MNLLLRYFLPTIVPDSVMLSSRVSVCPQFVDLWPTFIAQGPMLLFSASMPNSICNNRSQFIKRPQKHIFILCLGFTMIYNRYLHWKSGMFTCNLIEYRFYVDLQDIKIIKIVTYLKYFVLSVSLRQQVFVIIIDIK